MKKKEGEGRDEETTKISQKDIKKGEKMEEMGKIQKIKGKLALNDKKEKLVITLVKFRQGIVFFWRNQIVEWSKLAEQWVISHIKNKKGKFLLTFFRKDSAVSVVFIATALVTAGNLNFAEGQSGFLFGKEEPVINTEELTKKRMEQNKKVENLTNVSLKMAETFFTQEELDKITLTDEQTKLNQTQYQVLTAVENPDTKKLLGEGADVSVYEVKQGDTLSTIAADFGITSNTILWANDIDDPDMIQPGDKIFVLPISGVKHIVKSGDTLKKIAKKYEADEAKIIDFNDLLADGKIAEGDELIIPGGRIEEPETVTPSTLLPERQYYSSGVAESPDRVPSIIDRNPKGGHKFPYGYCTWYVASKKYVPWGGNAGTWLYNAKAYGAKTGKSPKSGAIIVTSESWYGHVGIVTKVKGDEVVISEMNYAGFGKVSSRTISSKSRVIKGYIY